VGKKAIKAKVIVAMTAILSASLLSWKNIVRLMKPKTQRGMNIDSNDEPGYL
jgi:hypothetical protein